MNVNEARLGSISISLAIAHHNASQLTLQGAGLHRQQVTQISIKGIIDVRPTDTENPHAHTQYQHTYTLLRMHAKQKLTLGQAHTSNETVYASEISCF